jgi:hypothetical protein
LAQQDRPWATTSSCLALPNRPGEWPQDLVMPSSSLSAELCVVTYPWACFCTSWWPCWCEGGRWWSPSESMTARRHDKLRVCFSGVGLLTTWSPVSQEFHPLLQREGSRSDKRTKGCLFFFECWGLNPGPCACQASTLSLELYPQPFWTFFLVLRQGLTACFAWASLGL